MRKLVLFRPVWLPTTIAAGLLLVALVLLFWMAWRSFHRLEPIHEHMEEIQILHEVGERLESLLVDRIAGAEPANAETLAAIRADLEELRRLGDFRAVDTRRRLNDVKDELADSERDPDEALARAVHQVNLALSTERAARDAMLEELRTGMGLELDIAIGALVGFPISIALMLYMLRRRIFAPLSNLAALMSYLGRRGFNAAYGGEVDPLIAPLVANYNQLVERLAALEAENEARTETLESQVRVATEALLEQQRDLANVERLASVGEVAAGLAHELRNPLAGIRVALENLRRDASDIDHAQRLDLVLQEVARIVAILNEILERSRHAPEPAREIDLERSTEELLTLARYQLPAGIGVRNAVPAGMLCHLPERRLRQALLNLVLNATQAMEGRPGTITIGAERLADRLLLSVCDEGPGFASEFLEHGIRPFTSGHPAGTGLGLSMVRRFASDLGGKVELSNREPHGARVTLNLPQEATDVRDAPDYRRRSAARR